MRAAVLKEGKIEVRETADPAPGPGEILVRTRACAICASDLHFMDHSHEGEEDDSGLSHYDPHADIVMGHEYSAEIVDYGPDTERKWAKGTRVSALPAVMRNGQMKIIGQNPDVPGGFGEYFVINEAFTRVIESAIPDELLCLSDAMAVGWYYVRKAAITAQEVPLVIGCGAIGLSVIAALKTRGIGPIIAADFVENRRRIAMEMGADHVIDPAETSPYEAWRDLVVGKTERVFEMPGTASRKQCVIFECVGVPGVLNAIVKSCEQGSRIYSAGGPPEGEHIHTMAAKRKGLAIQFGGGPLKADWDEAFDEVQSGRLNVEPMTGRIVGLNEMPGAIDDARDANGPARIVWMLGR
jgi:threonine dehydrogenase-like Zn-dependent dehydrogenase